MRSTGNLIRLLLAGAVLCGGWAAFAQVQTKPKTNPSVKKAAPKTEAVPEPKVNSVKKKAVDPTDDDKPAGAPKTKSVKPSQNETEPNAKEHQAEEKDAEVAEIQASAVKFVEAYNAHDAKAVAELFAKKAEFTDENGNLIQGREEIEADFKAMFEEFPDCKIAVEIDSIRVLTPHIALEEGIVIGQPLPDGPETLSNYVAIHVKVDGEWQIGSVSDTEAAPEELTPHDRLQELAWMVGEWVDESPEGIIKSSCRWDESGNYLLHEFVVQIAGNVSASGSMRIGWDAQAGQFRSWTFDADGGYSQGLWTRAEEEWVVKNQGVNANGETTSSVGVFRYLDDDTMTWRSYDRTAGGLPAEEIPANVIKRHPPAPEG